MDATILLERDHRRVERHFADFHRARSDARRRSVAEQLITELSVHSEIEKLHLYPAIRDDLRGGARLATHSLKEHQHVEEILAKLDANLDRVGSASFARDIARAEHAVEGHVAEEEQELFPRLRETLTKTRLDEIGKAMRRAKATVPTHPHPSAPNEGIAHEVIGRATGALDRARDSVSKR